MRSTTLAAPAAITRAHSARARGRQLFRRRRSLIFGVADLVLILAVWHLVVAEFGLVKRVFVPAPGDVLRGYAQLAEAGALWGNLGYSATNWSIGFASGVIAGVVAGLLIGSVAVAHRLVMPLLWASWATPLVAIQPIIGVWLGFNAKPIIALVFISTAIPVALSTVAGVTGVSPALLRAGRVYGANRRMLYLKVRLPWTLPYIIGGMRLAVPTSLIGLLVGEMIGAPSGMGSIITTSLARFRTNQAFASIVVFIVASVLLVRLIDRFERRVGGWRGVDSRG